VVDMPRVPDGRAGVCSRAGVLNRRVGALAVGCVGGRKLYILGVAGYNKPIWDVLALEGKREEAH